MEFVDLQAGSTDSLPDLIVERVLFREPAFADIGPASVIEIYFKPLSWEEIEPHLQNLLTDSRWIQ
jgi:hypothetical protein